MIFHDAIFDAFYFAPQNNTLYKNVLHVVDKLKTKSLEKKTELASILLFDFLLKDFRYLKYCYY